MKRITFFGILIMLFAVIFSSCAPSPAPAPTPEPSPTPDPLTYTVTYLSDGAVYKTESLTEGEDISLPEPPAKDGYAFGGWYFKSNGSKTEFTGGKANCNLFLTAEWILIIKDFTDVKFESVTATYDGTPKSLAVNGIPEGAEVSYTGTYSATDAGIYKATAKISKEGYNDLILEATLTINKAVYDMSGITFTDAVFGYDAKPHSIEINGELPSTLTVSYTGNGESSKGEHTVIASFTSQDPNYEPVADMTAKYSIVRDESIRYDITFIPGNEQPPFTESVVIEDTLSAPSIERLGYMFLGWYEDGAVEPFDFSAPVTESTTLTAHWSPISYSIVYETGSEDNSHQNPESYNIETPLTSLLPPKRAGYIFCGWYSDEALTTSASTFGGGSIGDLKFYASWTPCEYVIAYELYGAIDTTSNPAGYNVTSETITLSSPEAPGRIFLGWYTDAEFKNSITEIPTGSTGDIALFASWEYIDYAITYELSGGTSAGDNPAVYNTKLPFIPLNAPINEGYRFLGWYDDPKYSGEAITSIDTSLIKPLTLYARWEIFSINYVSNGGELPEGAIDSYGFDMTPITLPIPEKAGYTFLGWFDNPDFKGYSLKRIYKGTAKDLTYYAKWEITSYTVSYVLDGMTNSAENPKSYTVFDENISLSNAYAEGKTFLGWYLDPELNERVSEIDCKVGKDITLYASWKYIDYRIEYDLLGGTSNENQTSYNIDSGYITLLDPVYEGYLFLGWYDDPALTGEAIKTIDSSLQKNIKLYAKWEVFGIEYVGNGGILPGDAPTEYGRYMTPITLPTPAKEGFVFLGWYDNPDFKGYSIKRIYKDVAKDLTYYAKWQIIEHKIDYVLGGGTNSESNPTIYTIDTYNACGGTLMLSDPEYSRNEFLGWYLDQECTQRVTSLDLGTGEDYTLYAKWTPLVVKYSDFGTKTSFADLSSFKPIIGDGKTDDFLAIYAAHEWANLYASEIKADTGKTYYFGTTSYAKTITIKIPTDFVGANFIIDDTYLRPDHSGRSASVFRIASNSDYASYTLNTSKLVGITLSEGATKIDMTFKKPSLIRLVNTDKKIYIRYGANANSGGNLTEVLLVDENGNIDPSTKVLWDYDRITSIYVYPIDPTPIDVQNGIFTTLVCQPCNDYPEGSSYLPYDQYYYYSRNIVVQRSNVNVIGCEHYLENELPRAGGNGYPYSGFYSVTNATNVVYQGCVMSGHVSYIEDRDGGDGSVKDGIIQESEIDTGTTMGTYDIGATYANNIVWKNCTQSNSITDSKLWGVMGTNYCKNLTFDGSYLSRFDAHCGVYNATIRDSTVGMAINAIGEGVFLIENSTKVSGSTLVSLRSDYGSTWNGDIVIRNVTLGANSSTVYLTNGSWTEHYFGYVCYVPRIILDGFTTKAKTVYAYNYSGATERAVLSEINPLVIPTELILYNKSDSYKLYVADTGKSDGSGTYLFGAITIKRVFSD